MCLRQTAEASHKLWGKSRTYFLDWDKIHFYRKCKCIGVVGRKE